MTPAERADLCRRIASSGGRRTVERYGTAHMAAIGRLGFAKALELGWGLELAKKLAAGYKAKYGRPLVLGERSRRNQAIRAKCRQLFDRLPCDVCGAPHGERHHIDIHAAEPNQPAYVSILCADCHRAEHRARRLAHHRRRK